MFELLLYTSINCKDTSDIISRIRANENVSEIIRTEVIETLKEAAPHCEWDAHD